MNLPFALTLRGPQPARLEIGADALQLMHEGRPGARVQLPDAPDGDAWRSALVELLALQSQEVRADVVLHAGHARLFVLPSADVLVTEAHWLDYAAGRFEVLFGEPADDWVLRVVAERPGRPRLVVALPAALMDTLRAVPGLRLRSLWVDALVRLDALRQREAGFTGAAVDLGPGYAMLALFEQGVLQRLRVRRGLASLDELRSSLNVEWAALGHEGDLPALAIEPHDLGDIGADAAWRALATRVVRLH